MMASNPICCRCRQDINGYGFICCDNTRLVCIRCKQEFTCPKCGKSYAYRVDIPLRIVKNRVDVCCLCQKKVVQQNSYFQTDCNIRYCLSCMSHNYEHLQGSALFQETSNAALKLQCGCYILIQEAVMFLKQFCCFCLNKIDEEEYIALTDGRRIDSDCMRQKMLRKGENQGREILRSKFRKMGKSCIRCYQMIGKSRSYEMVPPCEVDPTLSVCNLCGPKPSVQQNKSKVIPSNKVEEVPPLVKKQEKKIDKPLEKWQNFSQTQLKKCDLCDYQSTFYKIFEENNLTICQICLKFQQIQMIASKKIDLPVRDLRNKVEQIICSSCNKPISNPHLIADQIGEKSYCLACKYKKQKKKQEDKKKIESLLKDQRSQIKGGQAEGIRAEEEVRPINRRPIKAIKVKTQNARQQIKHIKPLSQIREQLELESPKFQNKNPFNSQFGNQSLQFDLQVSINSHNLLSCTRCKYELPEENCFFLQSERVFNPKSIVRAYNLEERKEGIKYDPFCQICTMWQKNDEIIKTKAWKQAERRKLLEQMKKMRENNPSQIKVQAVKGEVVPAPTQDIEIEKQAKITSSKIQRKQANSPSKQQTQHFPKKGLKFVSPQSKKKQKQPNESNKPNPPVTSSQLRQKLVKQQVNVLPPNIPEKSPPSRAKAGIQVLSSKSPLSKIEKPPSDQRIAKCEYCNRPLKPIPTSSLAVCSCKSPVSSSPRCKICLKESVNPFCDKCKAESIYLYNTTIDKNPCYCKKCRHSKYYYYSKKKNAFFCDYCKQIIPSSK